nr:conserved hypothetical protein [Xanthomonas citri pv. citri]CEH58992.1 conserved hypothetical protein [Xanthomonas citri pv. citri]
MGHPPVLCPHSQTVPGARGPPNGGTGILSIPELPISKKRLKTFRLLAFHAQHGRCFYFTLPTWLASPNELGLRPRSARPYQCTAKHLVACQDGGKDVVGNVVAAHAACTHRRHKRTAPVPSATDYRTFVQRQLAKGKWCPQWIYGLSIGTP